jgi:hypothetical protein
MVKSASNPTVKVAVARDRPMMVRYCICQPYESFLYRWVSYFLKAVIRDCILHRIRIPDEVGKGIAE